MRFQDIDFSRPYEEVFAQIRAYERQSTLADIERVDAIAKQLHDEDLFNHSEFRKLRRKIGTQQEWGDAIGVSPATIGNYERNQTYPNKATRHKIIIALEHFRNELAQRLETHTNLFATKSDNVDVDLKGAKTALDNTILDASLTDFKFDNESQTIVPVPFQKDALNSEIEQLEQARADLLDALTDQAERIIENLGNGVNANIERLLRALGDYRDQCQKDRPNPRILLRVGNLISRSASNDEISYALTDFDQAALDEFSDDHRELMRLYYREALANAQKVEEISIDPDAAENADEDFSAVARELEKVKTPDGDPVFSDAIPTLLRDIASEIREYKETEILSSDPERKAVIKKRRGEAVKNGSILIGRFLIFASFIAVVDPTVALATAGSIASIIGVIQNESPGIVRRYYEGLRERLPFLPRYPSRK